MTQNSRKAEPTKSRVVRCQGGGFSSQADTQITAVSYDFAVSTVTSITQRWLLSFAFCLQYSSAEQSPPPTRQSSFLLTAEETAGERM